MAKRISDDNQSCWKTAKHPEKSFEKCVSKVWLSDPAEVQRNQNAPGRDCWTQRWHKYTRNKCSPELWLHVCMLKPKINYAPLVLLNSPSVGPEVSRSNTHLRRLSNNSRVLLLKIFYRPSGVDISGLEALCFFFFFLVLSAQISDTLQWPLIVM